MFLLDNDGKSNLYLLVKSNGDLLAGRNVRTGVKAQSAANRDPVLGRRVATIYVAEDVMTYRRVCSGLWRVETVGSRGCEWWSTRPATP